MKRIFFNAFLMALLLGFVNTSNAQFQMKFNVTESLPAGSGKYEVTIPVIEGVSQYSYDYEVEWESGVVTTGAQGAETYDYGSAGVQTITITPTTPGSGFPAISFLGSEDKSELIEIVNWGGSSFPWESFAAAFAGCENLTTIPSGTPNLSSVTDISYAFMGAASFNDADINDWDVSTITNMRGVFSGASIFNQSISNWDTDGVTDMSSMFAHAAAFNYNFRLGGVNWNTGDVVDMSHMLEGAYSFDQYIGNWDISSVEDMSHMLSGSGLSGCNYQSTLEGWADFTSTPSGIKLGANGLFYNSTIDRSTLTGTYSWAIKGDYQTSNDVCFDPTAFVTSWVVDNSTTDDGTLEITIPTQAVSGMTYDYVVDWGDGTSNSTITGTSGSTADATHTYSIPGNYTIQITGDFYSIYFNAGGDKDAIDDVIQWGDLDWRSFSHAFDGCTELKLFNHIDPPVLTNVTSLAAMFQNATAFDGFMGDWNVSTITNMNHMFLGASSFTGGGISSWGTDVGNVKFMSQMFKGASSFNHNINGWDVGSNTTLLRTFNQATVFNQPLDNWDVSLVEDMQETFALANSFNQDISSWNVTSAIDMEGMFAQNPAFNNGGQALNWERDAMHSDGVSTVKNVLNMKAMFRLANSFNQDIGNWDVSNVEDMSQMFQSTDLFDKSIDGWNVSNVETMARMFNLSKKFNKPLNNWNVSSVENMNRMFRSSVAFDQELGNWNLSGISSNSTTGMAEMFDYSNMSRLNYDKTLIGWYGYPTINPNTPNGITLGAAGLEYCDADNNPYNIYAPLTSSTGKNWSIPDDVKNCGTLLIRRDNNRDQILRAENEDRGDTKENLATENEYGIRLLQAQKGSIQIFIDDQIKNSSFYLNIYSSSGQLIRSIDNGVEGEVIRLEDYAEGLYIVTIRTNKSIESKKIFVSKH